MPSTRASCWPLLGLLALAALLSSCRPSPDRLARGAQLYQRSCALCHGGDGNGMPNLGKGLRGNEFVQSRSLPELVEFLKVGRRAMDPLNATGVDMPPRGGNPALSDEDLAAIATFLKSLASQPN